MENLADSRNINKDFAYETIELASRVSDLFRGTAYLWSTGTTFRNACDLMVLYLSGLLPSSPTHIGPLLGETNTLTEHLQQMCRNGLLTISSEPKGRVYNKFSEKTIIVSLSSIQLFVKNKHSKIIKARIQQFDAYASIKILDNKFSEEFGPSYIGEDPYTTCIFIESSEDSLFDVLLEISSEFN